MLNNMLINNQWLSEKIKEEIRNYLRQMKTEIHIKSKGWSKSSFKKAVYNKCQTLKQQEISQTV